MLLKRRKTLFFIFFGRLTSNKVFEGILPKLLYYHHNLSVTYLSIIDLMDTYSNLVRIPKKKWARERGGEALTFGPVVMVNFRRYKLRLYFFRGLLGHVSAFIKYSLSIGHGNFSAIGARFSPPFIPIGANLQ